jgi:mannosyltransferase OCH1-like enzyme
MIPKILMQCITSPMTQFKPYVIDQMRSRLGDDWEHHIFLLDDILKFFEEHPLEWCPDIIRRFQNIQSFSHRSDLFRYYWLYHNGGVYLDNDAMLQVDISEFVGDRYYFVSAFGIDMGAMCNGYLAATPKHPLIEKVLRCAYDTDPELLKQKYHTNVMTLYQKFHDMNYHLDPYRNKIYRETRYQDASTNFDDGVYKCVDEYEKILILHYQKSKIIPLSSA